MASFLFFVLVLVLVLFLFLVAGVVGSDPASSLPQQPSAHTPTPDHDVIIIGGGIVGLSTAVGLYHHLRVLPAARSIATESSILRIKVYERAPELRPRGANLGLFPNGITALRELSPTPLFESIMDSAVPAWGMQRRDFDSGKILANTPTSSSSSSAGGRQAENHTTTNENGAVCLVWYQLQKKLMEALSSSNVHTTNYDEKDNTDAAIDNNVVSLGWTYISHQVDPTTGLVQVTLMKHSNNPQVQNPNHPHRTTTTSTMITRTCRVLIGADGIHSTVRDHLCWSGSSSNNGTTTTTTNTTVLDVDPSSSWTSTKLHYRGRMMYRGVIPLMNISSSIQNNTNHNSFQTTTQQQLTKDGSDVVPPWGITATVRCGEEIGKGIAWRESAKGILTFTASSTTGFSTTNNNKAALQKLFENYPPVVQHLLSMVDAQALFIHPVYDIDLPPKERLRCGPVVLVGDAAHAMTPALGQGANMGLEDACVLSQLLARNLDNIIYSKNITTRTSTQQEPQPTTMSSPRDDDDDDTATATATATAAKILSNALETFWNKRLPRVKEVHQASRDEALYRNEKGHRSVRDEDFYKRLYEWNPVV